MRTKKRVGCYEMGRINIKKQKTEEQVEDLVTIVRLASVSLKMRGTFSQDGTSLPSHVIFFYFTSKWGSNQHVNCAIPPVGIDRIISKIITDLKVRLLLRQIRDYESKEMIHISTVYFTHRFYTDTY